MARDFGVDEAVQNANGVNGIDVDAFSIGFWIYVDAEPTLDKMPLRTANTIGVGREPGCTFFVVVPAVDNWRPAFTANLWYYAAGLG